jgi:hypothetical protein
MMTPPRIRGSALSAVLAALALIVVAACGEPNDSTMGPGGDNVVVAASTGTTPIYSWTGPPAVSLNVVRTSAPSVAIWGISSPLQRNIASGAQQGVVPPGATETASIERTLSTGVQYRVTVSLADGTSGSIDFTP